MREFMKNNWQLKQFQFCNWSVLSCVFLFFLSNIVNAQWNPFLQNKEAIGYSPIDSVSVYYILSSNTQDTTVRIVLNEIRRGSISNADTFQVPFFVKNRSQLLAHSAINRDLFFFAVNDPKGSQFSRNSILRYDRILNKLDTVNSWSQNYGEKEGFFIFGDDVHGFYFGPLNEARRCRTIYITSDSGNSWNLLDQANSLPWNLYQIYLRFTDGLMSSGYISGDARTLEPRGSVGFLSCLEESSPVNSPIVLKYSDFGAKWTKLIFPTSLGKFYRFSALSDVHWTVLNENMQFFHTLDAGTTWQLDTVSTKFFKEKGSVIDYKWSLASNDRSHDAFMVVNVRNPNGGRSTYITFDACKTWTMLDEYKFLSFYFRPNCLGMGQREMVKSYPGGRIYYVLTGIFDYPSAKTLSYPKLNDPLYVCKGESLNFSLGFGDPTYWSFHSDGRDTFQMGMPLRITPSESMEVYLFSPYHSDTLEIIVREPFPEKELETSYSVCSDSSLEIDLSQLPSAGFSWSNGQNGAVFQSNAPGNYTLQVEADYYCAGDYPFSISNYPIRSSEKDTAICPDNIDGTPINFEPELKAFGWIAPSSLTALPEFKEDKDLAYTRIDTNGCPAFIQWHIFTSCPPEFYLPNAFHPGGPIEANHYFQPVSRYVDSFHLFIYNRWGQEVYSGTQLNPGWDGTYANKEAESGMYFYRIVYTYTKEPHLLERKNLEGTLYLVK